MYAIGCTLILSKKLTGLSFQRLGEGYYALNFLWFGLYFYARPAGS